MSQPILVDRDELKALVHEAVRAAMQDVMSELKPLVKESVRKLLHESNGITETDHDLKVKEILEDHLVRYRKVWEALA